MSETPSNPPTLTPEEMLLLSVSNSGESHSDTLSSPPQTVFYGNPPPLLSFFERLIGEGLCVVFGDTGSGKTKLVSTLTQDALKNGKTVIYYDLEGNIHPAVLKTMTDAGCKYNRVKHLSDVYRTLERVKANILVVDSATLQITGRWFGEALNERGRILQELQYLYQKVADWCADNHSIAMMVAQPISEFGGKGLKSVGDKASFYAKTELYIDFIKDGLSVKRRELVIFKDRVLPDGLLICHLRTTATGVEWGEINKKAVETLDSLGGV